MHADACAMLTRLWARRERGLARPTGSAPYPGFAFSPAGLDVGNGADFVIVGGVAGNTDGAEQRRAVLDLHTAGHTGTGRPCASAFTALRNGMLLRALKQRWSAREQF